jgi:glycosyltransferase involved in cell wall biosynthesis
MDYRPFYFAREWVKMGHQVDIIAADYSHLRSKNPDVKADWDTEQVDGVIYHWIKTGRYEGNGVRRVLTMIQFVTKLYWRAGRIAKELKPDAVIASSTYPLDTYPARRVASKAHAKLVHEVHDMWPLTLVELGGMSKWHPFVMLIQRAENSFCKHSDIIISLPPCTREYLMQHGMRTDAFHHIPNGVVLEDWDIPYDIPEEHSILLNTLKGKGKFIVGYFGGHAMSNALSFLLEAAKAIRITDIHFVLVGDGTEKAALRQWAMDEKLCNITFLPPVPKLCIPELLKHFDCIYIGGRSSMLYRFGVCINKLYDSMMAGKPIIYAVETPNNDVRDFNCGVVVKPENIMEIVNAINTIYHMDANTCESMGERAKKAVIDNYEYTVLAKRFECVLQDDKARGVVVYT